MKIIGDNMTLLFPSFQYKYWKQKESFHFLILIVFLFFSINIFGQSTLSGKVIDADTGEPIIFGDVVVHKNGSLVTGTQTDFDGIYTLNLEMGYYKIVFKYVGYYDLEIENVLIIDDEERIIDAAIVVGKIIDRGCGGYRIPLISLDIFESGRILTAKEISNML